MSMNIIIRFLVAAAAMCTAAAFAAQEQAGGRIRLGISTFTESNPNNPAISYTISQLSRRLGPEKLEVVRLNLNELPAAVRKGQLDVVLASSGFYRRNLSLGLKDLATLMAPPFFDPNQAEASTFVVLDERTDLRTLKDLKGASIAANLEKSFSGYQIGMGEITKITPDYKGFFKRTDFVGHYMQNVLLSVLEGRTDAGVLRMCFLEEWKELNPDFPIHKFRVINLKGTSPCAYSTDLYPNWSFLTTPSISFEDTRILMTALLEIPPSSEGLKWGMATDFSSVDRLNKKLLIGPYSFSSEWFMERLFYDYAQYLWFILGAFALLAAHGVVLKIQVNRRTSELRSALAEQHRLQRASELASERLENLHKLSIIGQISSMVAHELAQPLSTIRCYASALERFIDSGKPISEERLSSILNNISRETARASGIVDKVRSYAKRRQPERSTIDLRQAVLNAAEYSRRQANASTAFECTTADEPVLVSADPLEVELALGNLVKNAFEAARLDEGHPRVAISMQIRRDEGEVRVIIENSGLLLSNERFEMLGELLPSEKSSGLGIGLSIASSLLERQNAAIEFERLPEGGLRTKAVFKTEAMEENGKERHQQAAG